MNHLLNNVNGMLSRSELEILNHEIRNPLTLIKINAQLLGKTDKANKKYLPSSLVSSIEKSVEAITCLLERYLDGNQNQTTEDKFAYFDISELIDSTILNFRMLHPDYEFFWTGCKAHSIFGDQNQIAQVLINYLNNAIKFSPRGSRITALTHISSSGIEVGISDEGIGVPNGAENRIFERFYQIRHNRQDSSSIGLGLYLVREMITGHGGQVWVQKSGTGGSIFYFSIPDINLNQPHHD